ncbi:MAG: hypothetical protein SPL32_02500 [Succiniclasticum sp.]|nr:hypothetical protein [Succiniclasticum sp.]
MKFLLINIGVGLAQALALTLAAPLLLGLVYRLASLGRPGPAPSVFFLYEKLGAARFHGLPLGDTASFVCVFLAASMVPGFLGAKITFGDFVLLVCLLLASAFLSLLYGGGEGDPAADTTGPSTGGSAWKRACGEAPLVAASLFLAVASRGFHAMATMLPDVTFLFRGTWFTGWTELAALGFFCLVLAAGEGCRRALMGRDGTALPFWGALAKVLQVLVLLMLFAELFFPLPLPSGPPALAAALLLAVVLAVTGRFRLFHRRAVLAAAPILLFLSILAQ